jgi:hypothetical protein
MIAIQEFLSGGVFVACLAVSLLFLRLHRKSNDRLFIFFAIAFAILAVERLLLASSDPKSELAPLVYLVRLAAYGCIIAAIIDKNRRA